MGSWSYQRPESDISSRDLAKDVARLTYLLGLGMSASLRFGSTFTLFDFESFIPAAELDEGSLLSNDDMMLG